MPTTPLPALAAVLGAGCGVVAALPASVRMAWLILAFLAIGKTSLVRLTPPLYAVLLLGPLGQFPLIPCFQFEHRQGSPDIFTRPV